MSDLPDSLVPAEVDLRDFAYMELDVRRLRDSRFGAEVSGDAFRAGVMLWCAAWHQVPAGSLPDDDVELANLAGYGRFVKEWKKVRAQALQGFALCSDGRLYHDVVAKKALQAWTSKLRHHYDRARDRLRKLNKQRAADGLPPLPELSFEQWNEQRLAAGIPMERAEASRGVPLQRPADDPGIPAESPLRGNREGKGTERRGSGEGDFPVVGAAVPPPPLPPATAPAASAATTQRAARLADDWVLPEDWREWATTEHPHWTPETVHRISQQFRDHWCSKAGKDAAKLDWFATWRNWCRDPKTKAQYPPARGNSSSRGFQPSLDELTAGVERRVGINPGPIQEVIDA